MATRREIREAFYSELESATAGLLDPEDIKQEYPNSSEELPRIVHNDNYRDVPMNIKSAPIDVETDSSGEQAYIYANLMQAQFTVLVLAADEDTKEDIYEAVRSYFEPFEHPTKDTSDIQTDVHRVEVGDANSQDTENRDPPARGDSLQIRLGYLRQNQRDTTPTGEVSTGIDVDDPQTTDGEVGDGDDDISYIGQ